MNKMQCCVAEYIEWINFRKNMTELSYFNVKHFACVYFSIVLKLLRITWESSHKSRLCLSCFETHNSLFTDEKWSCKKTKTPSRTASFHHLVLITGIVKMFVAGRELCKGLRLKTQSPGSCLVQAGLSHLSNQAAPSGTLITLAPGAVSCAAVQRRDAPYLSITASTRQQHTRLPQPDLTAHAQLQPAGT